MQRGIDFIKRFVTTEEKMLNICLLVSWAGIICILETAYIIEVVKGVFSLTYLMWFVLFSIGPYLVCLYRAKKDINSSSLRTWIVLCYFIMYAFVLLTGHTQLVFTYIFPILSFLILYHDPRLIRRSGAVTLVINIIFIVKESLEGKINVVVSRDYEIQIALIVLCFLGSWISSELYMRINETKNINAEKVKQLLVQQTILEEEKKFASMDYQTRLSNRKKFDEALSNIIKSEFKPFFLMTLDINGLKICNDTLGHLAGDELIVGMAQCLKKSFDESTCECFRMGGDEFSVICYCEKALFDNSLVALNENIDKYKGSYGYKLSASIGYVQVSNPMEFNEIVRLADEDMYYQKEKHYANLSRAKH